MAFGPIVETILIPEAQSPPLEPELRRKLLGQSKLVRRLLEVSALSPLEFVTREFEHDSVRAGLLFFNGLREVDLQLRGFGNEIGSHYGVHPTQVAQWKKQALDELPATFAGRRARAAQDEAELTVQLYQQIGQLKVELDWLKKSRI